MMQTTKKNVLLTSGFALLMALMVSPPVSAGEKLSSGITSITMYTKYTSGVNTASCNQGDHLTGGGVHCSNGSVVQYSDLGNDHSVASWNAGCVSLATKSATPPDSVWARCMTVK